MLFRSAGSQRGSACLTSITTEKCRSASPNPCGVSAHPQPVSQGGQRNPWQRWAETLGFQRSRLPPDPEGGASRLYLSGALRCRSARIPLGHIEKTGSFAPCLAKTLAEDDLEDGLLTHGGSAGTFFEVSFIQMSCLAKFCLMMHRFLDA